MHIAPRTMLRWASGLLVAGALYACESSTPVSLDDGPQQQRGVRPAQCAPAEISAAYSGPPNRENGLINLNDEFVYIEVLDVESHIRNRAASANDVRIGESWEDGTPAESFQILDIDNDGRRDVRVVFAKARLVADGNLDLSTTVLRVWGLDRRDDGEYCGSSDVEVTLPPPPPGQDVVVFNDVNPFDNGAIAQATDNEVMIRNLVTFTSDGPRNDGDVVWWDCGRNVAQGYNPCTLPDHSTARSLIADEGFTLTTIASSAGTLTDIPADVKSIWLWLPTVAYTNAEINALKAFAAEGGRIVFIGEWDGFYGAGIQVENDFLQKMGAVMRNTGGAVDCDYTYLSGTSIRAHQVTDDVDDLTIACASVIEPGPQDFVLYYDTSNTRVLAGVARISTAPVSGPESVLQGYTAARSAGAGLDPRSTTGH